MKVEREKLEHKLNLIISEYAPDKKIKNTVIEELKERNVHPGDTLDILEKRVHLSTIPQVTLYVFTLALHNATKESSIKPDKYFTDLEMDVGNTHKQTMKEKEKFPVVLEGCVRKGSDNQFSLFLHIKDVVDLYSRMVITYNPETQRQAKVKVTKNKLVEEININKKSVGEIKEDILNNKFKTNFITFNILQDGTEDFEYDEKNKVLTINSGEIDVLDGFHRSLGMVYAYQTNPNLDFYIGINITNYDVDNAKQYIVQEDKKNKIDKKYIKSINTDNLANMIVKKLNENTMSYLHNKITTDFVVLRNKRAVTMSDIMADAIDYSFEIKDRMDVAKLYKPIQDGLNLIIESDPEILKGKYNEFVFIGYVMLLRKIMDKDNFEEIVQQVLPKIDDEHIAQFIPLSRKISKPTLNRISDYIDLLLKGCE